jgi:hypothetical protein
MAERQVPSIGRVVHFVYGDRHYAALITDPGEHADAMQCLTVFPPKDAPFTTVAGYDPNGAPATWHWPEYVPAR